jgi:hypothetical protein
VAGGATSFVRPLLRTQKEVIMSLRIQGIATAAYMRLRGGGLDAYGQVPVRRVVDGPANPCRHCLQLIAVGETKLVLAFRPFDAGAQPYAETGPIFLHDRDCARYDSQQPPAWFAFLDPAAVRGYDADHWIRYETGQVIAGAIAATCASILEDRAIQYVHVRSKYGCFQCRVDRA